MIKRRFSPRALRVAMTVLGFAGAMSFTGAAWAQGEKTAVTINGDIITEQQFFERLQGIHGQAFLVGTSQLRRETAGQIVLDAMIVERLTLQAANKAKLGLSDAEVNAEMENLKQQPQVVAGLTGHLFTEEMLKYDIRVQAARFKLATLGVKISPEEVGKYYTAHKADYTIPERWGISLIQTTSLEAMTKVDADLKAGKSFAETAKLYSEDAATKGKGGDLGTIYANDTRFPAVLRDAVKPLKPGDITPTIKLEQDQGPGKPRIVTWWRLLLKTREPESVRPFAEMKSGIERLALIEKAGGYQAGDKRVGELRNQSDIKIDLPGYDNLGTRH